MALALAGLSLALYYAAFNLGGVLAGAWNVCAMIIAAVSLGLCSMTPRRPPDALAVDPLPPLARWMCCAVLAITLLQLVPVPAVLLARISPARSRMLDAAAAVMPVPGWSPLHAVPAEGVAALRFMACCALVFLAVRRMAAHWRGNPWYCVAPLVLLGAAEACLGLLQHHHGDAVARGTFYNSDHFAGLLEMILPFPVLWAWQLGTARRAPAGLTAGTALLLGGLLAVAGLMLGAVIHSLSRMGFAASLAALCVAALTAVPARRPRRLGLLAGLMALALVAFLFLPGDILVRRYVSLTQQPVSADPRFQVWAGSLSLIRDYPLLGCGLGAYQSCALAYKTAVPMLAVSHAHNDFLELAAAIGIPGCALVAGLGGMVLWAAFRATRGPGRFAACACCGSLVAMAGHSLVDFNLHIPANALVFAWILGLATSYRWRTEVVRGNCR